jgi:hypothetical protein
MNELDREPVVGGAHLPSGMPGQISREFSCQEGRRGLRRIDRLTQSECRSSDLGFGVAHSPALTERGLSLAISRATLECGSLLVANRGAELICNPNRESV